MEGTEAAWGRCGGSFPTKEGQLPLSSDVLLNWALGCKIDRGQKFERQNYRVDEGSSCLLPHP